MKPGPELTVALETHVCHAGTDHSCERASNCFQLPQRAGIGSDADSAAVRGANVSWLNPDGGLRQLSRKRVASCSYGCRWIHESWLSRRPD